MKKFILHTWAHEMVAVAVWIDAVVFKNKELFLISLFIDFVFCYLVNCHGKNKRTFIFIWSALILIV
jgi:hypothetical protein